jgi:uncharacterized membrane protein (UPF0127 family)
MVRIYKFNEGAMKRAPLISIAIFLVFGGMLVVYKQAEAPTPPPATILPEVSTLSFGEKSIVVELAFTEAERMRGLGGREKISNDEGMLFIFGESDFHGIWMKDMRFPLDILWLREVSGDTECKGIEPLDAKRRRSCLVVVDIREDALPESYPEVFQPREKASYVLEMNGGASRKFGMRVGSLLSLER